LFTRSTQRDRFRFYWRTARRLAIFGDDSPRERTGIRSKHVIIGLLLQYLRPFLDIRSRAPPKIIMFVVIKIDLGAVHLFELPVFIVDLKVIFNFLEFETILLRGKHIDGVWQLHFSFAF